MDHAKDVLDDLRPCPRLRGQISGVFEEFGAISAAVMVDGALDAKTKDLIAPAAAVAKRCDGRIASHAPRAFAAFEELAANA